MLLQRVVKTFILYGRQIPQARMQPLLIVHIIDELANLPLGVPERLVLVEIDLLPLQGFEEAFGLGIVIRVALGRHADVGANSKQAFRIAGARILHAAIGIMDQPGRGLTKSDRMVEGGQR